MLNIKKPYIIGETAYNHEGDLEYLYKMVDDISELGLNAVKFHILLNPQSYIHKKHVLLNELKKWIFNKDQWFELINYSKEKKLDVVMLCDDVESVNYIIKNDLNVDFIELHASSLNDYFLLDSLSNWPKEIILGIGGSKLDEILYAVNFLRNNGKEKIILMYGFQNYPTNYSDINLSKMIRIKDLFDLPVGYADHTAFDDPNNEFVSVMPASMGFNILEKHYTPDFGKERIDYHAAVGKNQFLRIKKLIELALCVYGTGELELSDPEKKYGNVGPMKKAIVAKKFIKEGENLSLDNLWFKRTIEESPIEQNEFLKLLGLKAIKDIKEDELITFDKIKYEFKNNNLEDFTNLQV
ncbi:N-acetylneuraminic acid synthase domain protein [Methanobacterium paludis]|uniref:N-acetylneuraminic acid synthase domain protein n=2 Tax=Methanobacterium paludis (strain DSM 25820 / JCM 18151 / SWAN1) TaxID=868131 RepID=F6D708_METPW|nr:N-acetylneuraminic acid synthase domain protein [Methanobacterium paludis]